jgi:hypothetical protein
MSRRLAVNLPLALALAAVAGCAAGASGSTSGAPGSTTFDGAGGSSAPPMGGGAGSVVQQPCQGTSCPTDVPPGQLTAGEWNDLAHWDFFTGLLRAQSSTAATSWGAMQDQWGFHPMGRFPVVVQSGGQPVADVPVELRDASGAPLWAAVTDNTGHAELYAGMFGGAAPAGPFTIATVRGTQAEGAIPTTADPIVVELPGAASPPPALDLMFLVDTTGSMGDELAYIQAELEDVVSNVKGTLPAGTRVRLSVDFYRDTGDAYVVRSFPFSEDVATSVAEIHAQSADGGGDIPEAVDQGLESAIDQHDWSADATARLLFIVLDAPPHGDAATLARVQASIASAAAKGIRVIPVSASGIDKPTEFLLRFFAVATGGTYVFLTDDSGIGNPHLDPSPTIGPFQVEFLNELLARVIASRT